MKQTVIISGISLLVWTMLFLLSFPFTAAAQQFVPLSVDRSTNISLAPFMTQAFSDGASLSTLVNALFKASLAIGAILAVLQMARAGFYYMGSDIWAKKEQGKQLLRDTLMGLLLLLAIWLILNQINPQILNLDALKGSIKATPAAKG